MSAVDYQFKLVLVGDEKAGKSSVIMKYVCDSYTSGYAPTGGTDFKARSITIDGSNCKLEIWDTAGQCGLLSSFSRFFRNVQGVFICYDVCSKASFANVPKYLQQVQMNAPVDTAIFIVACKSDCYYSRKVSVVEGERYAASKRCPFAEASAKSGEGVQALFQSAAALMLAQQLQHQQGEEGAPGRMSESLLGLAGDGAGPSTEQLQSPGRAATAFILAPPTEIQEGQQAEGAAEGQREASEVLFRRSTLTEGAVGTGSRLLQSAYPLYVSGAYSWANGAKINGRYVPRLSRLSRYDTVEVFSYWSLDSANTVMLYRENHWLIKRNRKELARLPAPSIDCFPDVASRKATWRENTGVYFTWLHLRPEIRCTALSASPAAALPEQAPPYSSSGGNNNNGSSSSGKYSPHSGSTGASPREASPRTQSASFSGLPGLGAALGRASFSDRASFSGYSEHGTAGTSSRVYTGPGSPHRPSSSALNANSSHGTSSGSGIFASILVLALLQQRSQLLQASDPANSDGSSGAEGVIIINMDVFYRCVRDPSRLLGLTPQLFARYCELRLGVLDYEVRAAPSLLDSGTLVKICAQTRRIREACADMLVTAGAGPLADEAPPVEPTAEAVLAAGRALLLGLRTQLAALCAVGAGSFEQAGRCRDVKVEVEAYLEEMRPGQLQGRSSFSMSMSGRASFSRTSFSSASGTGRGGGW
jgi:Ras-related protein Rab-5C